MRISTPHLSARRIIVSALVLALGAAAWMYVGPERLGGSATYVMVHGSSMEPKFRAGDLVIVRGTADPRIGDVVAYRSHDLGVPVLHRIIGIENGYYRFKGDNNSWVDRENITKSDLVGQNWVQIPKAGSVLEWTRTPSHAPLLTIPAALLLLGGFGKRTQRKVRPSVKRKKPKALKLSKPAKLKAPMPAKAKRPRPALPSMPSMPSMPSIPAPDAALVHGPIGQGLLIGVCLVALASAFLAFLAFGRPAALNSGQTIGYKNEGTFTYAAATTNRAVYDGGKARTGQPIFLRLSHAVDFGFSYVLKPDAPAQISGRASLIAVVKDTNGWKRTLVLSPAAPFRGDHVKLNGRLDLGRLRALINRVESATGVLRAGYQVAITPEITVAGIASGRGFADRFAPELLFQLDSLQLAPVPAIATADGSADPLHPTATGSLELKGTTQNTIRLLTARVEVRSARRIALVGGLLAFLGAFALALLVFRGRKASEAERINARHGWSMVPVSSSATGHGRASVKLDSIDALVRLADRRDEAVLHETGDGADSYFFEDGGIVYWYRVGDAADDRPPLTEPTTLIERSREALVNGNGHTNGNGNGNGNGHHGKRRSKAWRGQS